MLILRAIRTLVLVFATQAQIWVGTLLLPAHSRLPMQAKGRGLVALHWRGLAVDCEIAESKKARSTSPQRAVEMPTQRNADSASTETLLEALLNPPTWSARVALLAGHSADQALAALADAEMLQGELYEALLSFAATPGKYRAEQTAPLDAS